MKQISERVQLLNDKAEKHEREIRALLESDVQARNLQSRAEFCDRTGK